MITLKTLPQATAQEVFDQAALHLLTQNEKSTPPDSESCQYRYGNLKCVAGCFIADDEYHPDFEGKSWHWLAKSIIEIPADHSDLISRLQDIHDTDSPIDWPARLIEFAQDLNLSPSVVLNFTRNEEETSK